MQISEFLSGRCPLTVKLAVGAHTMYVQLQLSANNVSQLQKNQDLRAQSNAQDAPPTTGIISHPKINNLAATTLPDYQTNERPSSSDSSFATKFSPGPSAGAVLDSATCHRSSAQQHSPARSKQPTFPATANLPSASPRARPSCPLVADAPICTPRTISGQQSPTLASSLEEVCILMVSSACLHVRAGGTKVSCCGADGSYKDVEWMDDPHAKIGGLFSSLLLRFRLFSPLMCASSQEQSSTALWAALRVCSLELFLVRLYLGLF